MTAVASLTYHWDKFLTIWNYRAATGILRAQDLPCRIQGNLLPACIVNLVEIRTKGLIHRSASVNRAFYSYFSGLWTLS